MNPLRQPKVMAASIPITQGEVLTAVPIDENPGTLESLRAAKSISDPTAIQKSVPDIEKRICRRRHHTSKVEKPKAIRQSKRQSEAKSNQNAKLAADTEPLILTPMKLKLIIETVAREYVQLKGLDSEEMDKVIGVCQDLANTQFEEALADGKKAEGPEVAVKIEDSYAAENAGRALSKD